jgi:integrase
LDERSEVALSTAGEAHRGAEFALRFHDFRHDLATKMLRATGNVKMVRKAFSHVDIKTTTR